MNLLKFVVIFAVFGVTLGALGIIGDLLGGVLGIVTNLLSPGSGTSGANVKGIDVGSYNGNYNWQIAKENGNQFVYIRATGGVHYIDDKFNSNYQQSAAVGFYRGGYHYGAPDESSATEQVKYLLSNGGGWSADNKTLPAVLQLQPKPMSYTCYNISKTAMIAWIKEFSDTYEAATTRKPVIYTDLSWWKECTGNSVAFRKNPLWIRSHANSTGTLPAGWNVYTFWEYEYGADMFNGDESQLKKFVNNLN